MIALAIFAVGFLVAWKMSLQVTLWGGGLLIIMLVLYGLLMWSTTMSTPEDIFMANFVPESEQDAEFSVNLVNRVILGAIVGRTALVVSSYTLGGLLGRFALRFKKERV
ncbi:hypothetical protein SAMN05444287_3125 [Octadecabacter temperatus]|uniref:Uncharacterized protein n=1 Tax=Octadecabacter temperatus TaxID=1458307 RepID=A0A0K0Y8K4_9RHOB|nr:hypothetical protein [Octadecabacter temperatus]AKS47235.1 hypothetical protein OSB_27110 [Octadecabacter temperatus]SIO44980.1 hypothetical protein SAMN05444287_3125 [Octadecabacter temperatus]